MTMTVGVSPVTEPIKLKCGTCNGEGEVWSDQADGYANCPTCGEILASQYQAEIASLRAQLTAAVQERDEAREDRKRYATDLLAAQGQAAELEGANAALTRSLGEAGGKIALTEHRLEKAEAALAAHKEALTQAHTTLLAALIFLPETQNLRRDTQRTVEIVSAALRRLSGETTPHKGEGE